MNFRRSAAFDEPVGAITYVNVLIGYASGLPRSSGFRRASAASPAIFFGQHRGRRLDPTQARRRELAGLVQHPGEAHLVRQRVGDVDVGRAHPPSSSTTPATPELPRAPTPVGHCALTPVADLRLPGGADGRQVVGEVVRRAGVVRPVDRRDLRARQVALRVVLRDLRVVPLRDLTEVDPREDRPGEPEDAIDARQVVRRSRSPTAPTGSGRSPCTRPR